MTRTIIILIIFSTIFGMMFAAAFEKELKMQDAQNEAYQLEYSQ